MMSFVVKYFTWLEKLSPERIFYLSSLTTLFLAGLVVLLIDSLLKADPRTFKSALTRGLWKFSPKDSEEFGMRKKVLSWRKLIFAGLMAISLIASFIIKIFPLYISIFSSLILFIGWVLFLVIYWQLYMNEVQLESMKSMDYKDSEIRRLPLTIVTGFLGSGKTTLIKNILGDTLGMKILIIENEIGTEGIDHQLLLQQTNKEEIILMNNGCICCTVRKDLIVTFQNLISHESFEKIDWIIIETTGLADPAPMIQSLYMDPQCSKYIRLDGVVTIVDSKHFPLHIIKKKNDKFSEKETKSAHGGISEAILQVSYADRIVMNKLDLIASSEKESLLKSIKEINPTAKILESTHSKVSTHEILNIKAFDPLTNKALLQEKDSIPSIGIIQLNDDGKISKKKIISQIKDKKTINILNKNSKQKDKVETISLISHKPLDIDKFNAWISSLLQSQGQNIFRIKGILCMHEFEEQFVVHGIHMIFDGVKGENWKPKEPRISKLVFIGLNLTSANLYNGFQNCIYQV